MIPAQTGWQQTFVYDRYGNRRFDAPNTTTLAPGCAEAVCNPQIDPATNKLIGYQFDDVGNTKTDANGQTFVYDSENKQVQVNNAGGTVGQYFYNGDGQRVKKVVPSTGETTIFVYDAAAKLVAEYSTQVEPASTAKISYLTNDHLGSPSIRTDAVGQVVSRRDFRPFGEEIARTNYGSDSVRQKFTGYERDNESSLDYAETRYYGYNHGRFTSPDNFLNDTHKEEPASWNLYVYVRNNPLNYVDPSGEELQLVRITDKDGNVIENIDGENRKALLGWLNTTYGCNGCVTIDKNNTVRLDTSQVSKDVLAVTKDLTNAITDKSRIAAVIGYEGNADVNFAKAISASDMKTPLVIGGKNADAILIDFKDFRGLSGDKEAVSAFANYAFVHEVFHLFPSLLKDTTSDKDVTGPVENKVNEIRQVRGAMLRASYNAEENSGTWGEMYFGSAKIDKQTGGIRRNSNGGILVDSKKIVRWNLRMTGR